MEYSYLVKAIHLLDHVPISFLEGDSIDLDGRLVEEVLRNPDCNFRILHTMFYAINNGISFVTDDIDSNDEETDTENRSDKYDFIGADNLLIKTLHSYEANQNVDGSWSGISAEEAYSRISVVTTLADGTTGICKEIPFPNTATIEIMTNTEVTDTALAVMNYSIKLYNEIYEHCPFKDWVNRLEEI